MSCKKAKSVLHYLHSLYEGEKKEILEFVSERGGIMGDFQDVSGSSMKKSEYILENFDPQDDYENTAFDQGYLGGMDYVIGMIERGLKNPIGALAMKEIDESERDGHKSIETFVLLYDTSPWFEYAVGERKEFLSRDSAQKWLKEQLVREGFDKKEIGKTIEIFKENMEFRKGVKKVYVAQRKNEVII